MTLKTDEPEGLDPVPLMQLTAGLLAFNTFAAAVEVGLFPALSQRGPSSAEEVSVALDMPERPTRLLLAACASLGLLEKVGNQYGNTARSEMFLVPGRRYYFGDFVRFCNHRQSAWRNLTDALRNDRPLTWSTDSQSSLFSVEDSVMMESFWSAMHSISTFTARVLAESYDFSAHRQVLDVGGGSGAFLIELCLRYTHLTGTLLDLPHVCEVAQRNFDSAGLDEVLGTHPGDFLSGTPLPAGNDLIILSMILHDWDETTGRELLRKCYDALDPGGVVMICELLLNSDRTGPVDAALMGMSMLIETEGGQNYSEDEYLTWLSDTGFVDAQVIRFSAAGANGVVVARRP